MPPLFSYRQGKLLRAGSARIREYREIASPPMAWEVRDTLSGKSIPLERR
jgi:hypothetical protein